MFNKKGVAIGEMMMFIYRFAYAIFVIAMLVFSIKMVVYMGLETHDLEVEVLTNRIYNSPAIMYTDSATERTIPGIIDLDRFTAENIDRDINYSSRKRISAEITLLTSAARPEPIKTILFNEKLYTQLTPLVGKKGSSGATSTLKSFPVQYYSEKEFHNAILNIEILRQND